MKVSKLLLLTSFLLFIIGCGSSDNSEEISSPGVREFNLDSSKVYVSVGVFGVSMGTPDQLAVEGLLSSAKTQGLLIDYQLTANGIEGGGEYCAETSSASNAEAFFIMLQSLETNTSQTNYRATSVSSCL